MKYIDLTRGYRAIVDDEDFEWLNQWKWHTTTQTKPGEPYYARRTVQTGPGKSKSVLMHREILGLTRTVQHTDHRDGNGLNNRRYNLREATNQQNQFNQRRAIRGTSKFKGVCWRKLNRKWRAQIKDSPRHITLGYFSDEKEAAQVYDQAALKLFGEFTATNKLLGLL